MRIAAYCRVSTEKEEQQDSLIHQKEFFEEYARKNGHTLVRLYADEGITGTSLKKRTQFLRLLQDAKFGIFETVVVKDVSRFARNTVDFLQSIRELKSLGINTMFITANMESLGESEFILTIFGAMAQEESANLSKRVKFGKKINAQKGRVPQRIFGYDRIDNFTLAINYEESKVVQEIFKLYLRGLGCRTISLELNRQKRKTKFGCDWNPRGVRRVLTNPIYCGHYINHKYEIEDYLTGKQIHVPEAEQFHHQRPEWAIVSPETFQQAQEQLAVRRTKYKNEDVFRGGRYSSKHLFSTLIKCEHCGRSFCRKQYTYVNTRVYWKCVTNDQFTSMRCDNTVTVNEDDLLKQIKEYFVSLLEDKEQFINDVLGRLRDECALKRPAINKTAIEKRQRELLSKKERYQEMYANDVMTMSELKAKTATITEELNALAYNLDQYERQRIVTQDTDYFIAQYKSEVEKFLALEMVSNTDLRKVIDHIGVSRDGHVTIVLRKLNIIDV